MRRLILPIAATLIFASCSNPLSKPVTDELTSKELSAIVKKDTSFSAVYDLTQGVRKLGIGSAQFVNLSYKDLSEFIYKFKDEEFKQSVVDSHRQEWESEYAKLTPKADSLLAGWREFYTKFVTNAKSTDLKFYAQEQIPVHILMYLDSEKEGMTEVQKKNSYSSIIYNHIDGDFLPFPDFSEKVFREEMKKINPLAWEYLQIIL